MSSFKKKIENLKHGDIGKTVNKRLKEFEALGKKKTKKWFSELCFCILTANSRAKTAIKIQKELGYKGFSKYSEYKISKCIKRNKHRFHNNKARYIVEARKWKNIKEKLEDLSNTEENLKKTISDNEKIARDFVAKNVKGIGMKEASHFLRNVGKKNIAILDRHILNIMKENGYIKDVPKNMGKKKYKEIEQKFIVLSEEMDMQPAELDLYMWSMKTGEVLK